MKSTKQSVLAAFEDPRASYFSIVNDVLAFATIVSILTLVIETVPSFFKYHMVFSIIEWATVALFTAEYVLRIWATKKKRAYVLSFFGVTDLIAILPTFIGLGNLTFLKSARVVRIIRFLRLVRLSKLSHIKVKDAEETLGIFGFNIVLYAVTLIFTMLLFGVSLHILDTSDGRYWSIPAGMFWTFSVFLGGLPTPIPPGALGTTIFILAKFCGMALFGLLVGIVGKLFNQWILGKK
ncbi:MAG: ion transporter [Minisyncoccia bacterium]